MLNLNRACRLHTYFLLTTTRFRNREARRGKVEKQRKWRRENEGKGEISCRQEALKLLPLVARITTDEIFLVAIIITQDRMVGDDDMLEAQGIIIAIHY